MKKQNQELWEKMWDSKTQEAFDQMGEEDPELLKLVEEIPVEKIWARPGLPLREKSLITLSSRLALGRWDQVSLHMKSFLHMGGTEKELREVCIHLSIYCGFPAMIRAITTLNEVIKESATYKVFPRTPLRWILFSRCVIFHT